MTEADSDDESFFDFDVWDIEDVEKRSIGSDILMCSRLNLD